MNSLIPLKCFNPFCIYDITQMELKSKSIIGMTSPHPPPRFQVKILWPKVNIHVKHEINVNINNIVWEVF